MYERDESSVREKQEAVNDAEDEIAKAKIQDQIDLIEKEIKLLEEQKESIQATMESTTKYYEKLIKEQETYWDGLIEGLENQKSKWEELAEVESIANAYAAIKQVFGDLGYTVEDVLNGNESAFEAFKNDYLRLLTEMNSGNQPFIDGLSYATNSAKGAFGEVSKSAEEIKSSLDSVADATTPLSTAAENISSMGTAASTASSNVGSLKDATDGIASDVESLNTQSFDGLTKALGDVKEKIDAISDALVGETDSIKTALSNLNDATVLDNLGEAFKGLGESISAVAGMLGVATEGAQDATESSSRSMSEGASNGGAGLAKAIEEIKSAADTFIGTSAEDEGETAIGRFNLLKSAIQALVDDVIGNTEVEGTLIGSINSLPQVTSEALSGDAGAIETFNQFAEALNACATAATTLLEKIEKMGDTTLPTVPSGEGSSNGKYMGTAKYDGDWRVGKNEKSLVGELGPELVLRNGKAITVGEDGPEFVNLKKNDVVLNHLQTAAILDKKNQIRALADGSVLSPISSAMKSTQDKLKGLVSDSIPTVGNIKSIIHNQTKEIQSSINNITKVLPNPNVTINNPSFTVSGVTGEEVMRKIEGSFEGLMLNAYQKAMKN